MDNKAAIRCLMFMCLLSCSSGFDFTLEHLKTDSPTASKTRQTCGIARCIETLPDVGHPGSKSNHSRRLTSLSVYKSRLTRDGTGGHWQQLASLTPQQTHLDAMHDGMKISGQLTDQQAKVSLELVKTHDCLESQFSCVAVFVDNHGHASVKKSLVGKTPKSSLDTNPPAHSKKISIPFKDEILTESHPGSAAAMLHMMGAIQAKLDRMDDALNVIEIRLEDKVSELARKIDIKLDALDLKMNNMQARLEDKLAHKDMQVTENFKHLRKPESVYRNICDELAAKVDLLEMKQDKHLKQLDTCVAEVTKLSRAKDNKTEHFSNNMETLMKSMEMINGNLTNIDTHLNRVETATYECAVADNARLTDLASSLNSLFNRTEDLATQVDTLETNYSGEVLVPEEQYFDLLGTGREAWRLAFRGTPYIDVRVYPAFMHGTGIPAEVEQGCKQFNRSLPCTNHYRNTDAFDNWARVDEVLFGIFKDDQMVHRIIFNGKGSSYTSWFTESRVIDSSWDDLSTKSHLFFSITGDFNANTHRRFYISHDHDNGCNGFRGWFLAGDTTRGCAAENTVAFPTFFYATGNTLAVWGSSMTGEADAIGIFLKYE